MSWLSLLLLLVFGGITLWLLLNQEARVLMRELGRFALYRIALAVQKLTGCPVGYVARYRESVARDAGLERLRNSEDSSPGGQD